VHDGSASLLKQPDAAIGNFRCCGRAGRVRSKKTLETTRNTPFRDRGGGGEIFLVFLVWMRFLEIEATRLSGRIEDSGAAGRRSILTHERARTAANSAERPRYGTKVSGVSVDWVFGSR